MAIVIEPCIPIVIFYLLDSVEVSIDNKRGPHGKECVILILHQNLEGHLSLCPHQLRRHS